VGRGVSRSRRGGRHRLWLAALPARGRPSPRLLTPGS
jgi:hypothetical protein